MDTPSREVITALAAQTNAAIACRFVVIDERVKRRCILMGLSHDLSAVIVVETAPRSLPAGQFGVEIAATPP